MQHVPYEGLGYMENWLQARAYAIGYTKFYETAALPNLADVDWLIIMGGPMGANDEELYPWLVAEKAFISMAIAENKVVLGICLGAQLIAAALGARVYPGPAREIGWLPIQWLNNMSEQGEQAGHQANIIETVFHWHGDTFDLPDGARLLASSEAILHQAFSYGKRVLALQFHLEATEESLREMLENGQAELAAHSHEQYVQSASAILHWSADHIKICQAMMEAILTRLAKVLVE